MKSLSLQSRLLDVFGHLFVGAPDKVLGTPPGALHDLYVLPGDRTPPTPSEVKDPVWIKRRVADACVRHEMQYRVGQAASLFAAVAVVIGLAIGISASGAHEAWVKHHAAEAAVETQVSTAETQCAGFASQAATLDAATKQILTRQGCDYTTGKLDVDKFKAQLGSGQ